MYSFQRMKPGQIALLASLCALEDEEDFRRKLQADKPGHKVGFAFMTGTADEIKNKLQRCVIGCAFKHQIITRQEPAIFTLCQASHQALTHALANNINSERIKIKIALVSNPGWLAVSIYGETVVYQRLSHEIMGFSLSRFSPA
ncbi:TPA: HutP family protein [Klebsiella oxytoca]|nr:HutP family protein [Klebsiella oxytoca]